MDEGATGLRRALGAVFLAAVAAPLPFALARAIGRGEWLWTALLALAALGGLWVLAARRRMPRDP